MAPSHDVARLAPHAALAPLHVGFSFYNPIGRGALAPSDRATSRNRALCVRRVDPAPNDPGLLAAKRGAVGGGRALMRTLRQGFPPQCLIGVDRPRCKWLNLNFATPPIADQPALLDA